MLPQETLVFYTLFTLYEVKICEILKNIIFVLKNYWLFFDSSDISIITITEIKQQTTDLS